MHIALVALSVLAALAVFIGVFVGAFIGGYRLAEWWTEKHT
jgi:hypothetical protein